MRSACSVTKAGFITSEEVLVPKQGLGAATGTDIATVWTREGESLRIGGAGGDVLQLLSSELEQNAQCAVRALGVPGRRAES